MGEGLVTRDEARSLLVDQGIIPSEWTELEEDTKADDEDAERGRMRRMRERALMSGSVIRAAQLFPTEPIIRYHWPSGREVVLWDRASDVLRRQVWPVAVSRQTDNEGAALFAEGDVTITEADVERAIEEGRQRVGDEFAQLLEAEPEVERQRRGLIQKLLRGKHDKS